MSRSIYYIDTHEPLTEDEITNLLFRVKEDTGTRFKIQICLHNACLGAVSPDPEDSNYTFRFRLVAAIYVHWFLGQVDDLKPGQSLDEKTIRFFAKLIHKVANLSEASVINLRNAFEDFEKDNLVENLSMAILREFLSA